jgi:hypothetical protein
MAYSPYDVTKPDPATQAGTAFGQSTRDNIRAMRDSLAALGSVPGFDYSYTTGTAEQPTTMLFKRSAEWIKLVVVWGTVGGEAGNATTVTFYYSSDSGSNYYGMADAAGKYILTMTYDSSGNCTATTWS